jgi:type VI secretion system protein ImpL
MQNLPTWLLVLIIAITVVSFGGFFWYLIWGGEEEEDVEETGVDPLGITAADGGMIDTLATTTEELKTTARESRMIRMKESFERSLDSREGRAHGSAKDRMTMPWFMLVGADGSGKKTILANNGLDLPWGPPLEVDNKRKDAGKWWLFEDAVVLEAPPASPGTTAGTTTLPPGQTVADSSVGWSTLLHMVRRERPDSPLNGIIVTISCADLLSARNDPERMEEQADRINAFLTKTRNFLGVRLPVHVLVTKCDTLPGFKSFADSLPASRRDDIFGWANPNDPETRFDPTWIDNGFTQLYTQLSDLRDEVLAAPETVRDSVGVFVFDTEFADLQDTLKAFVARILTVGERRPTLFFRGFYFTGDARDEADKGEIERTLSEGQQPSSTRISREIAAEPHTMVFLKSLFSEKIFKEAGLARPMSSWRLSRDRRVVAAQAAAIIIALIGGTGLWMSVNGFRRADRVYQTGLRTEAEMLTRVLSGVAIDLDEVRRGNGPESALDRRARDAAVLELVAQMRDVPSMGVRSPFIPSSWFSPLPRDIKQSMMAGIQTIVLPVTRQRLEERASRLLGTSVDGVGTAGGTVALAAAEEFEATDPRALTTYLSDVRTLSRNVERYNSLADSTSGSVAELSALLDYLFGEQIASDSALATSDFEDALKRAAGRRIVVPPAIAATVINRAVGMVAPLGDHAARQLSPRATPAMERAIRPEDDLRALSGLSALVQLVDRKSGIVATIGDSAILGVRLARTVEDSITAHFARVAKQIVRDAVSPDSSPGRLRIAIERLYSFRMMDPTEDRRIASDIRPNERLRWDVGRLELALSLPSEFLQALVTLAEALPAQTHDRMRRALAVQLRARVLDAAASAQRFTPLPDSPDWQIEAKSSGANLDEAAKRIVRLAQSLDTLQARAEGRMLIAAGARQAEHALAMAQRVFESWTAFTPRADSVARWQGVLPLSFRALGVTDSTTAAALMYSYGSDVSSLARDVAPAVRYLRSASAGDSSRVPVLVSRWESIGMTSQRFQRGEASSTLGTLLLFVRDGMGMSDLATCTARASVPDTVRASNDVFVIRRRQFRAAMVSRCGTTGAAQAVASYERLRTLFQTRLAGRYPFADTVVSRRSATDADPAAVREFFRQYDAFRVVDDIALRSHPVLTQTARAAITFIDQLSAVRALVAPFTDSASIRGTPAYGLVASARISPDTLPTHLLDLEVGGRQATIDEAGQEHLWRSGDSVKVILSPLDTASERTLYAAGGSWAALRFAQNQPAGIKVRIYHPDTKLELIVPRIIPITAPEILIPRSR